MKLLLTAFNGKTNSSKLLLDELIIGNKLYLKNSFDTSVKQLIDQIELNDYDLIISFGQANINKDTIQIETTGKIESSYKTSFDYNDLVLHIKNYYSVVISNNAGNYLCNNIYYYGLKFINDNDLKTKMIFIHIPKLKNISIIDLAKVLNVYIENINKSKG